MKNPLSLLPPNYALLFPPAKICEKAAFEMVTRLVESPRNQKQEIFRAYIFTRESITEEQFKNVQSSPLILTC